MISLILFYLVKDNIRFIYLKNYIVKSFDFDICNIKYLCFKIYS